MDFRAFSSNDTPNELRGVEEGERERGKQIHTLTVCTRTCTWLTSFGILICCVVVAGPATVLKTGGKKCRVTAHTQFRLGHIYCIKCPIHVFR